MRKTLLSFLTLLLLIAGVEGAMAQTKTVTFDATKDLGKDAALSKDGVTIKAVTKHCELANTAKYSFHKNYPVTFTSTVGNITKVVFTCDAIGDRRHGPGCFREPSTGTYSYLDSIGTWAGDANSFTLTPKTNPVWVKKIEVTIGKDTKKETTVSFATPSYTFTQGSDDAKNFKGQKAIVMDGTNIISDATVTYTLDPNNTDLTTIDTGNGTVVLNENKTGSVRVTAAFAGNDIYEPSKASYTINVGPKTTGDGMEANPYTVADLILLNKSNVLPTGKIYVKGIISKVGELDSSYGELNYYISDDGNEASELEVYNGLGLNGDKFTAVTDLEAGWTVTVMGTPTFYKNTTLEIAQGSQITNIIKPQIGTPVITGTSLFLNNTQVAISCDNADAKIYYTLDGTKPTTANTLYSGAFTLDKTATVTAVAYVNGKAGKEAQISFTKVDEKQITTVADALAKTDNTVVYVKGIVAQTQKYNSNYTNLNYYLSDDGTSASTLEVYHGKYLNDTDITNEYQIVRGDEVIVAGTITTYNNVNELKDAILLSLTEGKETTTITTTGWATYVSRRPVDFSNASVKAYTVKYNATSNTITLSPVTKIPGNTAVVLKGNEGTYTLDHTESADALTGNNLEFDYADKSITTAKTFYVLAKVGNICGFYPMATGEMLPAYKGYIYIKDTTAAKAFYTLGNTTTGINNTVVGKPQRDMRYNLAGQRTGKSYKGIVILNGKKVIVR